MRVIFICERAKVTEGLASMTWPKARISLAVEDWFCMRL